MPHVRDHYDAMAGAEWERLAIDPFHQLEFRATMACLREYLPSSGLVLDAGGGPGRYALALCQQGYSVVLLDLSEQCIKLASDMLRSAGEATCRRLQSAEVGDIRDLSRFADDSFDAALCLGGTLCHVSTAEEQGKALRELVRVGKPGAPVFISVISYYAVLRTVLVSAPDHLVNPVKQPLFTVGDNVYTGSFPEAHFFRPEELQALSEESGLRTVEMRACEGLSSNLAEATNALKDHNDGRWERWLQLLDRTMHDPAVVATSEHFLYVGQVPPGELPRCDTPA